MADALAIGIRPIYARDQGEWRSMIRNYDPDIAGDADYAWGRFFDKSSGLRGRIATCCGAPAGFMHYVFHDFSVMRGPICYLADLYVKPEFRRRGVARAMIEHLIDLASNERWTRIYWVTEHDNPARALYDQYGIPEFVRYHIDFAKNPLEAGDNQ